MRSSRHILACLRRFRGSDQGQGLVEFAVAIPIVLFLFFGVFEFGRFFYSRLTLQYAVAEAARFAVTGNVLPDTLGDPMSRVQSLKAVIERNAQVLDVDVDRVTVDPIDAGGPGDVVKVTAEFTFRFVVPGWTSFFPNGELDFRVSTSMKNEPFFLGEGG